MDKNNFKALIDYKLPHTRLRKEKRMPFSKRDKQKGQEAIKGLIGGTVDEKQATKIADYFSNLLHKEEII